MELMLSALVMFYRKKYLQGRIISVEIERRDPRKVYFSVVLTSTNAIDPIILSTASAYSNGPNRKSGSLVLTDMLTFVHKVP